jgi:DNA mismatch repair protein MutS
MSAPATASPAASSPAAAASPMLAQWQAVKASYPDCLLFYRMGDFYELFFDDAVAAAAALDIALTKRGQHEGEPVPMAGVPVHAAEQYLPRLIRAGHRVAVCEQMEGPADAKKRGSKSIVRRDVVRVITPGTLSEDTLLDARRHNYLAACAEVREAFGLAWLDMSTGEVWMQSIPGGREEKGGRANLLAAALARIAPGELLVPDRLTGRDDLAPLWSDMADALTPLPASRFDSANAEARLCAAYGVGTLDAFGAPERAEIAAAGALLDYLALTQVGRMPRLARPHRLPPPGAAGAVMEIDAATRRNLELAQTLGGERRGSLLWVIDRTVTGAGARLLADRLAAPLTDVAAIEARLDAVAFLVDDQGCRTDVREALRAAPDIERALSRLTLGRGGPRDLAAIRTGLEAAARLRDRLAGLSAPPSVLVAATEALGEHGALVGGLAAALDDELPLAARDGGFVRAGYSTPLDDQRALRDSSRQHIAGLQARYAEETGIASLKVKHNNVLGYFVELGASHAERLMEVGKEAAAERYGLIHRQTMANAVRFTTVELSELDDAIARAGERALALEIEVFEALVADVLALSEEIARAARALAELDVAAGLAELAVRARYVRPTLSEAPVFRIRGGRHPVVEAVLDDGPGAFVANDCDLSGTPAGEAGAAGGGRLWLVTGPNMAGKSTFLRQNALIAILAQIGAFVPADAAEIGVVDRLFSRVGAADDLARGRSTFMVEMVETAAILNQAGPRALVILDEIGRGTATFDGLSIAWATVEHLHETNRCRTLFATHFHELTRLAARLPELSCHTMRVKEWNDDIVFLHEVGPGAADRSYGIHVGKLAGLPGAVVGRAEEVLHLLEAGDQAGALTRLAEDLPLFQAAAAAGAANPAPAADPLRALLAGADPDTLTPRDALDLIYRLKAVLDG